MPIRIQRSRAKGWRAPEGAIYVGRPGPWGNPYWHQSKFHGVEIALALFAETARGCWKPELVKHWPDSYVDQTYCDHQEWLRRIGHHPIDRARRELRGHDLMCWCSIGAACHADILLEIANG